MTQAACVAATARSAGMPPLLVMFVSHSIKARAQLQCTNPVEQIKHVQTRRFQQRFPTPSHARASQTYCLFCAAVCA